MALCARRLRAAVSCQSAGATTRRRAVSRGALQVLCSGRAVQSPTSRAPAAAASSAALGVLGARQLRLLALDTAPDASPPNQRQLPAAEGSTGPAAAAAPVACANYLLVSPSWQPLVGRSRQHLKMEHEVKKAAATALPVCISGEAGLHKLKVAAAIHTLGLQQQDASHPMVVVDCSTPGGQLQATQLLLAPASGSAIDASLHALLADGTVVLHNAHKAPHELLALADAAVAALLPAKKAADNDAAPPAADQAVVGRLLRTCCTRLVLISQQPLAQLQQLLAEAAVPGSSASSGTAAGLGRVPSIAVPPLRTRASDIAPLALQAAEGAARLRGYGGVALSEGAAKRLTAYAFPGNVAELRGLVSRAVMLHPPAVASASACSGTTQCGSCGDNGSCGCGDNGSEPGAASSSSSSCCRQAPSPVLVLQEGDFWGAFQESDKGRLDVLELLPWLQPALLDSGIWPGRLNAVTKWLFPLVVASLFLGPQDREHSAALTVFWAGWWPLVFISFPFVGRAWCAICPFMVSGRQAQKLVEAGSADAATAPTAAPAAAGSCAAAHVGVTGEGSCEVRTGVLALAVATVQHRLRSLLGKRSWQLKKWPVEQVSAWGGWFLVTAFASILIWEEVWDLPNSAALSGWLLLLITGGAVACSLVYEKRLWCRYLCPVGGMNGLFAKLSMTEIRSRLGICAAAACSRPCHKGRLIGGADDATSSLASLDVTAVVPEPAAAAATQTWVAGCPMNTYPAKHTDNHDCVMCGNCLRSCPQGSAQWRLRPPGADLWSGHHASWEELSLMYVLLGAVVLHRLPELCGQLGITPELLTTDKGPHMAASAALLAAPGLLAWAWDAAGRRADRGTAGGGVSGSAAATAAANDSQGAGVPFLQLSYSLLPLVWAGTVAHYTDPLLGELGLALPRLAASLGAPADAAWLAALPVLGPAPAAVISVVQGTTLLLGGVLSWVLAGRIASEAAVPATAHAATRQRLLVLAVAAELWHLIV